MPEIFQVLRFRRFQCNEKSGFHVRARNDHPRRPKGNQLGRENRRDESFPEDVNTDKSAFLIPTLFIYGQITFQSSFVFNHNYNFYCARDNFGAWANCKRDKLSRKRKTCRLFSRGLIFTRARVLLALLSLRKNGGILVVLGFM